MRAKTCLTFIVVMLFLVVFSESTNGISQDSSRHRMIISLHSGWKFRQLGSDEWKPAEVPGCVHTDLLAAGDIGDPFFRDNEKRLQWIGKTDWEYATEFELDSDFLEYQNIELVFDGLDTYAKVYLNNTLILKTDNMFRRWRISCKSMLKTSKNTIRIHFESPINKILPVMTKLPYQLPAGNDQGEKTSPFTRKAPYHFGWDWGPRFVTCGIWRPVYLEGWDQVRIDDLYFRQESISEDNAGFSAIVELAASGPATVMIEVMDSKDSFEVTRKKVVLKAGTNSVAIPVQIDKPILWWPSGFGEQHFYDIRVEILNDGEVIDEASEKIGLRSLELRREPDQWGESFEFVVNGIPVFAKGANWIPADSFPVRVTPERYRLLLESCADANMNMLRVWGGGIYEDDKFYKLCDELGIMVWQDFMFSCSMYPGDPEFLEGVREEAVWNVKRLRNHPCLVLWCGNNEVETAWFNWGWKERFPKQVWTDYEKIFHGILPEVCAVYDPSRPYWPSSPSSNRKDEPNSPSMGDVHYWDVWHSARPFEEYRTQFPRFMSEYGFQAFPSLETISTFTLPEDRNIESEVMTAHQKHPRGNQLIREYMLRRYPEPKDFESFLYLSQVLQAEGIKIAAEHLRRIKPRCMGSLYWQANDCWPVASWSGIDYFGRWKALHYYARRFYNDILVSPVEENGKIAIYVVSDKREYVQAELVTSLLSFSGEQLKAFESNLEIKPGSSEVVLDLDKTELLAGQDSRSVFMHCFLTRDGEEISSNLLFFRRFRELSLPKPNVRVDCRESENGIEILLSSEKLAKDVYLELDMPGMRFSDNFFDLLPGEVKRVKLISRGNIELEDFRSELKVRSLVDFIA